jgi:formyl-CoA transferase
MADVLAGLSLSIGILAALKYKDKTGMGQKVDISLVDSVVSSLEIINQIYLTEGRIPQKIGNRYESVYPYDSFRVKDGSIVIGCGNDKLWQLLCNLMGKPELVDDDKYDKNPKRVKNHAEVKKIVEVWTIEQTIDDAVEKLLKAGIPAAPINTIDRLVNDPHIAGAREMFVEVEHPVAGKLKITGSHLKFSDTKTSVRTPSPILGQDNKEVYGSLVGLSDEEIEKLHKEGTI